MKEYNFTYHHEDAAIPYKVWATEQNSIRPHTILFLGTVQIERLVYWVAEACPANTFVVQGAPHWFAKEDGSNIPEYMTNFTSQAMYVITETFSLKSVAVIAESQAVPSVLKVAASADLSKYFQALILLQPLGLNINAYTANGLEPLTVFKSRIARNTKGQLTGLLTDAKLRYNHKLLLKYANPRSVAAQAQYRSGLVYDALHDLKLVYKNKLKVTIITAENDKLFPPHEIYDALTAHGLDIALLTVPKIPHSPLASRQGKKLLSAAFSELDKLN